MLIQTRSLGRLLCEVTVVVAMLSPSTVFPKTSLPTGVFTTKGGAQSLDIQANGRGSGTFQIEVWGANGHICSLGGNFSGLVGLAKDGSDECKVDFKPTGRSVLVGTKTDDACRGFCGARAWFAGEYLPLPKGCSSNDREKASSAFLSLYKSRRYAKAFETLDGVRRNCTDFIHWMEADRIRNDLAITQFHLKNKTACLAILSKAVGSEYKTEEELKETLAPLDFDAFLPTAQATWFNIKRCSGEK